MKDGGIIKSKPQSPIEKKNPPCHFDYVPLLLSTIRFLGTTTKKKKSQKPTNEPLKETNKKTTPTTKHIPPTQESNPKLYSHA